MLRVGAHPSIPGLGSGKELDDLHQVLVELEAAQFVRGTCATERLKKWRPSSMKVKDTKPAKPMPTCGDGPSHTVVEEECCGYEGGHARCAR